MYLSIFPSGSTRYAAMTTAFHNDSNCIVTIIPSCALCERAVPPLAMCSVPAVCAPLYLPWVPSGQASLALLKALCQNFCHSGFHVSI